VISGFAVERIDHVEVFVRDVEAALEWYARVLGLSVAFRWDPEPVLIGAGGTMLALFRAQRPGTDNRDDDSRPPIRWRRVAWRTTFDNLDFACRHLSDQGVPFKGPIDHGMARSIYFQDPDGNPLEITAYV